jgi:hypothetical protein
VSRRQASRFPEPQQALHDKATSATPIGSRLTGETYRATGLPWVAAPMVTLARIVKEPIASVLGHSAWACP